MTPSVTSVESSEQFWCKIRQIWCICEPWGQHTAPYSNMQPLTLTLYWLQVLAKHYTIINILQRIKPLWSAGCCGPSHSWLKWKKSCRIYLPPLPKFFALFSTEKISALLVCEEKKLLPLISLPACIPPPPPLKSQMVRPFNICK